MSRPLFRLARNYLEPFLTIKEYFHFIYCYLFEVVQIFVVKLVYGYHGIIWPKERKLQPYNGKF